MSEEGGDEARGAITMVPEGSGEAVPLAKQDGNSIYRRRIRLRAGAGRASAELEDDFHHFVARIEHDGERVTCVGGEAIRFPWTTCSGAVGVLAALEGVALTRDLHQLSRATDPRMQCTHLFDSATLAISFAASGRSACVYDAEVPELVAGSAQVRLSRDGQPLLEWPIEAFRIQAPGPLEDQPLIGPGFSEAVRKLGDPALEEPVLVLRRAVLISMARVYDMDRVEDPQAFARAIGAKCFTFSPVHGDSARRIVGANRDFSAGPEGLLI